MTPDFGDVPTWISAVSGLGALVAAASAAWFAKSTWELEAHRDEGRRDETRREQAGHVAAYPGQATDHVEWDDPDSGYGHREPWTVPGVTIRNASPLPIYEVVVDEPRPADSIYPINAPQVIPPETTVDLPVQFSDVAHALTDPSLSEWASSNTFAYDDDLDKQHAAREQWTARGRPAISFTDAAGLRWRRRADGRLEHIEVQQVRESREQQ